MMGVEERMFREEEAERKNAEHNRIIEGLDELGNIKEERNEIKKIMEDYDETKRLGKEEHGNHHNEKREHPIHPDRRNYIAIPKNSHWDNHPDDYEIQKTVKDSPVQPGDGIYRDDDEEPRQGISDTE